MELRNRFGDRCGIALGFFPLELASDRVAGSTCVLGGSSFFSLRPGKHIVASTTTSACLTQDSSGDQRGHADVRIGRRIETRLLEVNAVLDAFHGKEHTDRGLAAESCRQCHTLGM